MKPPQAVTNRYVSNLLTEGQNDDFELEYVRQEPHMVGEDVVGFYYMAEVKTRQDFHPRSAAGVTPRQAVRKALEKHGVTFK